MAILAAVITMMVQAIETIVPAQECLQERCHDCGDPCLCDLRGMTGSPCLGRAPDRDAVHAQRRLTDADRHALAVLAAGADAGIELQVAADHADAAQIGWAV